MAERLVVLSDMWGVKKGLWITSYLGYLQQYYNIVFYDIQQLSNIDLTIQSKENLHAAFVESGIDTAVTHLLKKEKTESHYLAFSTGGTIAYKAALKGLPIKSLYTASATRIRMENLKPECPSTFLFGGNDKYKPNSEWVEKMNTDLEVIPNFGHECYTDEKIIGKICQDLLASATAHPKEIKKVV